MIDVDQWKQSIGPVLGMSRVFLSYAREDRPTAEKLAQALTDKGHSVFWDRNIRTGEVWDEVLARELQAAQSVIVLWSEHSVSSRWVKAEASEAAERGILLPAVIDKETRIPFQFKLIQTVDLTDWDGSLDGLGMQTLLAGIDHPTEEPKQQALLSKRKFRWRTLARYCAAGLAVLMVAAGVLYGIGRRQGWFSLSLPYCTWLESSEGLVVGDPVLLDGKPVGRITTIELAPPFEAFKVFVGLTVQEPYFDYIWSDSKVKVQWNPSKLRRYIHLIRGGTSTNTNLHASYRVDSKTGSRSYWDEKTQAYKPLSVTGANRFGFSLLAEEAVAQ
jgi:hypothetical protein